MVRKSLQNHLIGLNTGFRFRGENPSRIENFSDAIFALAVTLLLISTRPPDTVQELITFTKEIIPFAVCITFVGLFWWEHFVFFLRYGFRNRYIVFLNVLLMFIILFYVYPLKFLAGFLITLFMGIFDLETRIMSMNMVTLHDLPALMLIYGAGAAGIFLVFVLMYRYAFKERHVLELNELEVFDTRMSIRTNIFMASVPLLSCLMAIIFAHSPYVGVFSGFAYFLYLPLMFIHGFSAEKKRKSVLARLSPN